MGIQFDISAYEVNRIYDIGPRYVRTVLNFTPYQKRIALSHLEAVGDELISTLADEYDRQIRGIVLDASQPSLMRKLLTGQINEAVMIGERTSLEIVRRDGRVVFDGISWHQVH